MQSKELIKPISDEETFFMAWLDEAIKEELVEGYTHQPIPFKLSSQIAFPQVKGKKTIVNELLKSHEYQADFLIHWGKRAFDIELVRFVGLTEMNGIFECKMHKDRPISVVDVKGSFGANKNDQRFPLNQKWVYSKYSVYVQKVVPFGASMMKTCLFAKTWTPRAYAFRNRKDGKGHLTVYVDTVRMIDEYLNSRL